MREYGKVSPQFWVGETGKALRGDMEAQLLALYLMSSPHSRMTGIFYCPVHYMSHETGIPIEGASKGLRRLIEAGFCEYDEDTEFVFVVKMAAYQIGDELKPGDKRLIGIRREIANLPETRMKSSFLRVYGAAYGMAVEAKKPKGLRSPLQAPPKPGAGAGAGAGEEKTLSGKPDGPPIPADDATSVLAYLNAAAGKHFRPCESNLRFVRARLKAASVEQCRAVIDAKVAKWGRDPKMAEYLRPATLFAETNFEQYVGELGAKPVGSGMPEAIPWFARMGFCDERSARAAGAMPDAVAA